MWNINYNQYRDFSGSPEVGTLPSNAEGMGSKAAQEVKTLHAEKPKHKTEVTTKKDFQKGLHLKKKSKIIISNIDWGNISIYNPLL